MWIWLTILASGFLALSFPSAPPAADKPEARLIGELKEDFKPEVSVSGDVVVGILREPTLSLSPNIRLQMVTLGLPQSTQQFACVEVLSRDGRYTAEATYQLEAPEPAEWITLPYPTQYRDLLVQTELDQVAVIAYAGRCEEQKGDGVFIAAWRSDANDMGPYLKVLVNSRASDRVWIVLAEDKGNSARQFNCEKVKEGPRIAFDYVCLTPYAISVDVGTLVIHRERRGNMRRPITVHLR
jgi:hypothetical protein